MCGFCVMSFSVDAHALFGQCFLDDYPSVIVLIVCGLYVPRAVGAGGSALATADVFASLRDALESLFAFKYTIPADVVMHLASSKGGDVDTGTCQSNLPWWHSSVWSHGLVVAMSLALLAS